MVGFGKAKGAGEILLDYVSPLGRTVTQVRGTMLVTAHDNLRAMGLYERYCALLPRSHHEQIVYALASSWLPVELLVLHYQVCDQLEIMDSQVAKAGELAAKRISETFFGAAFRGARYTGVDGFPILMSSIDRFLDRLYRGGGCTTIRTGPKDLIVETHGLPFSGSRYYRAVYASYFKIATALFCRTSFCKYTQAREPDPYTLAITCSWV
jgi:hypothetical protein